jgi:hypothetical protein
LRGLLFIEPGRWARLEKKGWPVMLVVPMLPVAAAGWAALIWIFGGGLPLAIIVFIVLKMMGK